MIPRLFGEATAVRFDDRVLPCPLCKADGSYNDYVHICEVKVNQNGLMTTIERRGDFLNPNGPKGQRGSIVQIIFWCENGHQFEHVYEFHKGNTICSVERLPDCPVDSVDELWRD